MADISSLLQATLKTKRITFNLTGIAKRFLAIGKSLPYIKVEVGLLSKGKKNVRKRLFAVQGLANRTPVRSPVQAFIKSGNLQKTMDKLQPEVAKALGIYINNPKSRGSPISLIKKSIKPFLPDLAKGFQDSFDSITPPITKRIKYQKSLVPLVETGKLRKSVRARFVYNARKRK